MPFSRVAVKQGTSPEHREAIALGIHQAMVDTIGIPEDDLFQLISEYSPQDFFFDRKFLGIDRSDDLVVIQLTMRRGRSDDMKKKLYASISENIAHGAGIRPQDIFIYLTENDFSDWSVGGGRMSMQIIQQRGDDA